MSGDFIGPRAVRSGYWWRWPFQSIVFMIRSPVRFIAMYIAFILMDSIYGLTLMNFHYSVLSSAIVIAPIIAYGIWANLIRSDCGENFRSNVSSAIGIFPPVMMIFGLGMIGVALVCVFFMKFNTALTLSETLMMLWAFMASSMFKYPLAMISGTSPTVARQLVEVGDRMNVVAIFPYSYFVSSSLFVIAMYANNPFLTPVFLMLLVSFWYVVYRDIYEHEERTIKGSLNDRIIACLSCHKT